MFCDGALRVHERILMATEFEHREHVCAKDDGVVGCEGECKLETPEDRIVSVERTFDHCGVRLRNGRLRLKLNRAQRVRYCLTVPVERMEQHREVRVSMCKR